MMQDAKVIEEVARAIARVYYEKFLHDDSPLAQPLNEYLEDCWANFIGSAEAAIKAHTAALTKAGLVVVPREATQHMIDRGTASNTYLYNGKVPDDAPPDHDYDDDFRRIWSVMIAAATSPER